jgi:hypothetical protein
MLFYLLMLSFNHFTATADSNPYCTESEQQIRNFVIRDPLALNEKELLKKGESAADLQRLALTPGPFGHSELGFRYLAKFFGYEGSSYDVNEIERDILRGEYFTNDNRSGAFSLWKSWVVEPKKRLSVPSGDVSSLPNAYVTDVFFENTEDKAKFAKCLSDAMARSVCASSPNLYRRELMPNDRLTVAKSSKDGRAHCLVTLSAGTKELKERDKPKVQKSNTPVNIQFGDRNTLAK